MGPEQMVQRGLSSCAFSRRWCRLKWMAQRSLHHFRSFRWWRSDRSLPQFRQAGLLARAIAFEVPDALVEVLDGSRCSTACVRLSKDDPEQHSPLGEFEPVHGFDASEYVVVRPRLAPTLCMAE